MQRIIGNTVCAIACLALASPAFAQKSAAPASPTLARIKQSGKITFGYQPDARPFSYRDEWGVEAGFSVVLCQRIADAIKTELGVSTLKVEWVPPPANDRFSAVADGKVDAFCGADTETLSRRQLVSFSIPVFP